MDRRGAGGVKFFQTWAHDDRASSDVHAIAAKDFLARLSVLRSPLARWFPIPRDRHVQSFRASSAQVPAMSSYCVFGGGPLKTERKKRAGVGSAGRRGVAPITSTSNFLRAARLWCATACRIVRMRSSDLTSAFSKEQNGSPPRKKAFARALFRVVIRQPIDVGLAAQHDISGNGGRPERHARMDLWSGGNSAC
jgi:hypothetical protein